MILLTKEPGPVSLVRNPVSFEFQVDHATIPVNHCVKLKIFFEKVFDSNIFEEIVTLEEFVNSQKKAIFNISSILESLFQRENHLLPLSNTTPIIADNRRKYKIQYTESYGSPIITQGWAEKTGYFAFFGGIDSIKIPSGDFFQGLSPTNSFLSFYPQRKEISVSQPEYLKWYNFSSSTKNVLVEIDRWNETGNIGAIYIDDTQTFEVKQGELALLPCGHNQIGLDNTILKYTARVVDAASDWEGGNPTYLSQAIIFYVDYTEYEEYHLIAYMNSFGLPETLRVTGSLKTELEITRTLATSYTAGGYAQSARDIRQYTQDFQNVYTYRTGYISKQEVDALQELLIYNECYLLTEKGYFSLLIEDKKFNIHESFQFLHAIEFNAIRSLRAKNYSNDFVAYDPLMFVMSCPVGVEGRYTGTDEAQNNGVSPGQYFANMEFAGAVQQLNAEAEYLDDTVASTKLVQGSCYPVSRANPYGFPRHTIRKLNPTTTYNSDSEAAAGGVAVDKVYYAGGSHNEGVTFGTVMIRKN
jgi:hypothetical protein